MTAEQKQKERWNLKPVIGLTIISLLLCGLAYPYLITGIGQVFFPYQSNGEIIKLNGKQIGSELIAQNFTMSIFFHPRNDSASGVDPHIPLNVAYEQVPQVSNATGIDSTELTDIVNRNQEGTWWIFGAPYVNVLKLNLYLIQNFPLVYKQFQR